MKSEEGTENSEYVAGWRGGRMGRGSENRVVAVPSFFTRPTLATNSSTAISVVLTRIAVF